MTALVLSDKDIFYLPPDMEKRLEILAQKTNHSKIFCMKEALATYIEDREDYLIAEQRLKEFEESGEQAIPFEEIVKKLGLDDDKQKMDR